ncbi:MAG: hypothetical protein LBI55_02305 [Oscillospiraceae bacterium]|nr:hypothetical protein [Oscillospiraceae bacterium]
MIKYDVWWLFRLKIVGLKNVLSVCFGTVEGKFNIFQRQQEFEFLHVIGLYLPVLPRSFASPLNEDFWQSLFDSSF